MPRRESWSFHSSKEVLKDEERSLPLRWMTGFHSSKEVLKERRALWRRIPPRSCFHSSKEVLKASRDYEGGVYGSVSIPLRKF